MEQQLTGVEVLIVSSPRWLGYNSDGLSHHSTHFNLQIHQRRREYGGKTRSRQEVETMSNELEIGLETEVERE